MKQELLRRASIAATLEAWIRQQPLGVWIASSDLTQRFGGAWRSRLVAVRQQLAADDLAFVWNRKNGAAAAYQLRPVPLGRPAEHMGSGQPGLFR